MVLKPGGRLLMELGYQSLEGVRRCSADGWSDFEVISDLAGWPRVIGCSAVVCHVDMDAFFVSVEELFDPSLKGKPVVVGGKRDQRGVVAAASYAARKFGVHSAMPLRTASRLCPQAIFVEGHPARYREYSQKVFDVLTHFSPQVEMASIDEAYLDLTGTERLHGPPLEAAHALHEAIGAETQFALLAGLGGLAAGGESRVRSGQAERRSLHSSGARGALPRAARGAQDTGRRQEDRSASAHDRHPKSRRSGGARRSIF